MIAVDGGYDTCRKYDVVPDLIVGDFDSAQESDMPQIAEIAKIAPDHVVVLPTEKDDTDMMLAINPDVKIVGLLYSNSEANSTTPIAEAKAYLDEKGIAYVEGTGNTNDEIMSAAANMVGKADAVFTPTDNVVMAAAAAVSETLTEAGIPFYTGADSFVTAGAFATCGVNYTELGTYTADMVLDILESGNVPEYHVMDGGIITVNTETAAALGIDYAAFSDMASQVVEVTTQQ